MHSQISNDSKTQEPGDSLIKQGNGQEDLSTENRNSVHETPLFCNDGTPGSQKEGEQSIDYTFTLHGMYYWYNVPAQVLTKCFQQCNTKIPYLHEV